MHFLRSRILIYLNRCTKVILLATQTSAGISFLDIMAQIIMVSVTLMQVLADLFFDYYVVG